VCTWRWSCRNCVAPSCVALLLACAAGATAAQANPFDFSTSATACDDDNIGTQVAQAHSVSHSIATQDPPIPSHTQTCDAKASVQGSPFPNSLIRGRVTAGGHVETDAAPGLGRNGLALPVANAEARLSYVVDLGSSQQLPLAWRFSPFQVPLVVDAPGSETEVNGFAGVELRVKYVSRFTGSTNLFFDEGATSTGTTSQMFHVEAFLTPQFTFLGVDMFAGAGADLAIAPNAGPWVSDAVATLDPSFSFDQAAFDVEAAQMGLPTFPLDQYFSFQFSPGLDELGAPPVDGGTPGTTIPEPPTFALVVPGLILLIAVKARPKRDR
jgi:hypothetical protein